MSNPTPTGCCVFLTGLSGAGKTTIACALAERLQHDHGRTVTLLDGDAVRTHLSVELGFSRQDRDRNIARIGFVAAEVARHGGIAIAAAIAPFDAARRAARQLVEEQGYFLLVHLATPLTVCEARDPKGLYAKARRGEITAFTGVSDPYEVPADAELAIDTATVSVNAAVSRILETLQVRDML